jgi:hypothetical protein
LFEFLLRDVDYFSRFIEKNSARAGGALIKGENVHSCWMLSWGLGIRG